MDKAKFNFILGLVRYTYKWYGKSQAAKRSQLGRGFYYCENPECGVIVKKRFTQLDHIIPVQAIGGFDSVEATLDRALPPPEGYQRLCLECHHTKTQAENALRPAGNRAKGKRKKK